MFFFKILYPVFLLFLCNATYAQNNEPTPPTQQMQQFASPWYLDTGIRYWLGQGNFEFNLYNTAGDEHLSRLTDQDVTTNTAEGFWRLNHQDGVFFKGYVGAGSNIDGKFIDEDFPPGTYPYSRTKSDQAYGRLNYFSVDLGYDLFQHEHYKLSPFIGYHYWLTHYHGLGCQQTAGNPDICTAAFAFSNATDTLNDHAVWNSLRLGINGEVQLLENLNFAFDAAYIYAYLLGHDFHNLRPDIRGEFFEGTGDGVQLDMAFNWLLTPNLSMGAGARWWKVKTEGYSHFEETAIEGRPQYAETTQQNYGLIVQSKYRFDDSKQRLMFIDKDGLNNPEHWKGLYLGANLGYGMYPNNVSILPYESTSEIIADLSPLLIHLQSSGFLGGGQVGYNWMRDNLLWGIESELNYAYIGGTNSISFTPSPYFINNSVTQHLNWFGTARAKLGKVVSNTLLPYVTAGFSLANTELTYAQSVSFLNQPVLQNTSINTQTDLNWVAGAGLEYAVSDHVRYKLEYLYLNLGELKLDSPYYAINSDFASNILRLGINYHF